MSNLRTYDESYPAAIFTATPGVGSLSPSTAVINAAALTVTVTGTDFTSNSEILADGVPAPTTYVSATSLRTTVTPGPTPRTIVVRVKTNGVVSTTSASFTVTATGLTRRGATAKTEEPDDDEVEEDEDEDEVDEEPVRRRPGRPKGSRNRPR